MAIFYIVSGFLGLGVVGPLVLYLLYVMIVKIRDK